MRKKGDRPLSAEEVRQRAAEMAAKLGGKAFGNPDLTREEAAKLKAQKEIAAQRAAREAEEEVKRKQAAEIARQMGKIGWGDFS